MNKNWEEIAPISFALPSEGAKEAAQWLREVYLEGRPLVNDSVAAAELGRLYGDALIGLATHRYLLYTTKTAFNSPLLDLSPIKGFVTY